MREKLSALIPCKNEENNIRACLESVRRLADEIVVADSGSTDGTLDIVRRIGGCRVICREYCNPASFKNWAIPQCTHPWVLILDADERVTEQLAEEIRRALGGPSPDVDAFTIPFLSYFLGHPVRHARYNRATARLIRREQCRYQDRRVHESIVVEPRRLGRLSAPLLHFGFHTYDQVQEKLGRYSTAGALELRDQGKHAGFSSLLVRPVLRFLHMYLLRLGFLDGLPGLQVCMIMSFHNTFFKQGKLWALEYAVPQCDLETAGEEAMPTTIKFPRVARAVPSESAGVHSGWPLVSDSPVDCDRYAA